MMTLDDTVMVAPTLALLRRSSCDFQKSADDANRQLDPSSSLLPSSPACSAPLLHMGFSGSWLRSCPNRFLIVTRCLENLSSGEKRANSHREDRHMSLNCCILLVCSLVWLHTWMCGFGDFALARDFLRKVTIQLLALSECVQKASSPSRSTLGCPCRPA